MSPVTPLTIPSSANAQDAELVSSGRLGPFPFGEPQGAEQNVIVVSAGFDFRGFLLRPERADTNLIAGNSKEVLEGEIGHGYFLKLPLPYEIRAIDDGLCAEISIVGLWAVAQDQQGVIEELKNRLLGYFHSLQDVQLEDLGSTPQRHRVFLESILERV